MRKTLWLLSLLLVVIFTLFGVMVYSNRGEPTGEWDKVWRGWKGEARKQPYSLIQSVLEKNGIHLEVRYHLRNGLNLEDYDALILSGQSTLRDEKDKDYLISWVRHGGHLLISGQNELAQEFGVQWRRFGFDKDDVSGVECDIKPAVINGMMPFDPDGVHVMKWINQEGVLFYPQVELKGSLYFSGITKRKKRLGKFCGDKFFIINKRSYAGMVTIFAHDIDVWANAEKFLPQGLVAERELVPVARGDNAAYLHDLLDGDDHVLMVRRNVWDGSASDWHLPKKKWWTVCVAAVLMMLTVLWFFGCRLGTLIEVENTQIADISEHLQAAGRYWESSNSYGWLAQNAWQRLQFDLEAQRRCFSDEKKLIGELAARCQQTFEAISQVLSCELPKSETEFIQFMAIVEDIRMVL